ncbi:MAG TPA: hypothetical protein PKV71_03535 [Calditrichia bacterium]|nr:hypothetical protein [Calditrichota bacterium]HQV30918.1 hypothetical protein [Calditrichia bacterium]
MRTLILLTFATGLAIAQNYQPLIPYSLRGDLQYEREGTHDANNIRTLFLSYGMVGSYPPDPLTVDLSVFHSVEVPKGSNENYSDGITPFVLARVRLRNGSFAYIMETGYRERQGTSPYFNRTMRFEPRPGYFQTDPTINTGLSPAVSNDPRTWPDEWVDKLEDPDDPGWSGSWNGYFGKRPAADQESYVVFDDQYYDAWDYFPDDRDAGEDPLRRRRGLGLRVEQRGFQWANPQAGNVIFWHYDITNEATIDYVDNIIFGLYMDSGVGGSGVGVDGVPESDDDNAFFDQEAGLNLVYTWDNFGHGVQGPTGYLGYSYMETPGNPTDGIDNDLNGIIDERRDGGPGQLIEGTDAIRAYVEANYDMNAFENFFGPLEQRPAFRNGLWWTGDEDMDWVAEFSDTGADGIFESGDTGEGDGIPTRGEPNFDRTDVDESDQIGLTGFKMNRIKAGPGATSNVVDNVVFFDNGQEWPRRLFDFFTTGAKFDNPLVENYNIGFLFASGPFTLEAGKTERFSLALGWGANLRELRNTTRVVQQIYKANYQFAVPPPQPTVQAFAGDGYVTVTWDDKAERAFDPVTSRNDFEGYRIYRSTDPDFQDPDVITTGTGSSTIGNGKPIAQFDLVNDIYGFSPITVEGVAYFLGEETGLVHTFTDTDVTNGQEYYYAVCAYDQGSDSIQIYPSENAITVSRTLRGGTILPPNVVVVRPNPPALGYTPAALNSTERIAGKGTGTVEVEVVNSSVVPDNHQFEIHFDNPLDSARASFYSLIDVTTRDTLYSFGKDFRGEKRGPVGAGILVNVNTGRIPAMDTTNSGFRVGSSNLKLNVSYAPALPTTLDRPGYPDDIEVVFGDTYLDTSIAAVSLPAKPAKLKVVAKTDSGDYQLNFRFRDLDNDGTLNGIGEYIEVVTYARARPTAARATWQFSVDTTGLGGAAINPPGAGEFYDLKVILPFSKGDVFTFASTGQSLDRNAAHASDQKPYVVPNPYVGAASFEPARFAVSGRGERRMEFRGLPAECTIRIFSVVGDLVQTLEHSGEITEGFVPWDLRSKDNLEVAPGLYIYHVESEGRDPFIGKFAIIK